MAINSKVALLRKYDKKITKLRNEYGETTDWVGFFCKLEQLRIALHKEADEKGINLES